jgi:cell division protein FtsB
LSKIFLFPGFHVPLRAVNIWEKLTRVVIFLIVAAALLGGALWYAPLLKQNERMRKQKLELDKRLAHEQEVEKKLDTQMRSLQDPRTVERLAREKLSYAKQDEIVIRFEEPPTNSISPR